MSSAMQLLTTQIQEASGVILATLRFLLPLFAGWILLRCGKSLLRFRREPEIWAWLSLPNGDRWPVTHWENTVGRSRTCDISVQYQTISRLHGVLTRYDDGSWTITDAGSKGGITVDGVPVSVGEVAYGQVISLGGVEFTLQPINREQELAQAAYRRQEAVVQKPGGTLLLLTLFQALLTLSLLAGTGEWRVLPAMGLLVGLEWLLFAFYAVIHRTGMELELLALLLSSVSLAITAVSHGAALLTQSVSIAAGMVLFLAVGWCLRDLHRAGSVRYGAAVAGILLLAAAVIFGSSVNGARNWIYLGSLSVQPSELTKVCFVFVCASTMDRVVAKRNLTLFLVYTGILCLSLAILSDFGSALVFFTAFLVVAFLRSGNFATVALICAGTGFAGLLAVRFLPYIQNRFAVWGHVWENALSTGYQQTRAMMCIAAGGLFGLGSGQGWLHFVGAAETDLVFAFVGEEYGLIMAVLMVTALVLMAVFTVRIAPQGRSGFYTIGACAALTILLTQTILNVFGTVDLLPLTGVTFPFLSQGGSAMVAAWGLLAFVKSADTRQNASFTIRLPREET